MKCIHIADVHFRGLKRHDEYRKVFEQFFAKSRELNPDIIFIGGDIVHSKTQGISPELIDLLCWWFDSMSKIAKVHVILGNHDGLILNEDRQDAITPIVKALNNDNIFVYKKSGVYPTGIDGFNWCVFSCFDEKNWDFVKPVSGEINIACFHGGVLGSKTDVDWNIDGEVGISFFKDYDFAFLGDIHKYQYLDDEKRVAYPGSTIQQNFGEDTNKGFIFWDIKSRYDYNSKFYKLENDMPFVSIEWKDSVEKTIDSMRQVPHRSRIRIKSSKTISQLEIQTLHKLIKEIKDPSEIVYRIDNNNESVNLDYKHTLKNLFDIKNTESRSNFLLNYLSNCEEETVEKVNNLFTKNLHMLLNDDYLDSSKNKWSINSLKFDNTFGYGKNNYINFNNMKGIVGIFGKNRCGKSSIPGTLMYGLFNTSDRGSIKNLHIINTRKGECNVEIDFSVNSDNYIVKRSTKKSQSKKGVVSANTKLSLSKINNDEEKNETEEQRRETEKILRKLIGTSEDFLYTSFASQGEINTFIKEKNTARKTVLSKFLNLDIYEDLWRVSREEYTYLKSHIKTISDKDWNSLVSSAESSILLLKDLNDNIEIKISEERKSSIDKSVILEDLKRNNKKHRSGLTFSEANDLLQDFENRLTLEKDRLSARKEKVKSIEKSLSKISLFKESFPIEDLNNDKEKIDILKSKIGQLESTFKVKSNKKTTLDKKLKILEEVPCGDKFKSCKFIKDAHASKENQNILNEEIKHVKGSILEVKDILHNLSRENIEEKVKKYNDILNKEYKLNIDISSTKKLIKNSKDLIKSLEESVLNYKDTIKEISELETIDNYNQISEIKKEIKSCNEKLNSLESEKETNIRKIFKIERDVYSWEEERNRYEDLLENWKIYDLFTHCVSKKGIPTKLIEYALPAINKEIQNILQDVTGFTIEISADQNSNSLDIFINYGDSKRIIECASGMEKMMASLAIRIALINISSLPRSDLFIIDEGFGSLDETNVEACGRFLRSLRKWFKTILIISHVDSIKDIVDNTLEIGAKGKDSHVIFN
jgi:DNA repair exonuclease SbcCD ATPase subunit